MRDVFIKNRPTHFLQLENSKFSYVKNRLELDNGKRGAEFIRIIPLVLNVTKVNNPKKNLK